jgi:hypothetical protein
MDFAPAPMQRAGTITDYKNTLTNRKKSLGLISGVDIPKSNTSLFLPNGLADQSQRIPRRGHQV